MNSVLFAWALLAISSVGAHHRCDDVDTAAANALTSPLAKAVQKAKADKDAALEVKLAIDESLEGGREGEAAAERNLASAQAALQVTTAKVAALQAAYTEKSLAVAACQPAAAGSDCTISDKN